MTDRKLHRFLLRFAAACGALAVLLPLSDARAGVVFQQIVDLTDTSYPSDFSYNQSIHSGGTQLADDFRLQPGASTVTGIRWWGTYNAAETPSVPDAFTIRIFEKATTGPSNRPTTEPLYEFFVGDNVGRTDTGIDVSGFLISGVYDVFSYAVEIPATTLLANTTYWLSIVNDTSGDPDRDWFWSAESAFAPVVRNEEGHFWARAGRPPGFVLTDDPVTVPEPASLVLFGAGLAGLGFLRRRRGPGGRSPSPSSA